MLDFIVIVRYNNGRKVGKYEKENFMIIELRKKSQITLSKEIVRELDLHEGDKFEVFIENGKIILEPVVVYPKEFIMQIENEIKVLKEDSNFKYNSFDNIDDLMKDLKIKR